MISRDATLAFTQAALALMSVPKTVEPYTDAAVSVTRNHVHGAVALAALERVVDLLRRGAAPDVGVVAKFIVELEAARVES